MIVRRALILGVIALGASLSAACSASDPDLAAPGLASPSTPGSVSAPTDRPDTTDVAATGSKDPITRSPDAVGAGVQPEGITTVTARITAADGEKCDVCMWLADSADERSTGLMGVTDLGGPVGMAFSWDAPTAGQFFMLNTPTPLSIAWFAESGEHVGQTDMTPCITDDSSTCARYGADAAYTLAIEMFEGQLGTVGIAPGARVELLAGTESPTCVTDG